MLLFQYIYMINKDTIILLNKSDISDKQNHKFDVDTVLASVKSNKNIDKLINLVKAKLSKKFSKFSKINFFKLEK